jgi:hypothetical protein
VSNDCCHSFVSKKEKNDLKSECPQGRRSK